MARTFQITDGTTTINLINVSGYISDQAGFGEKKLIPHIVEEAKSIEDLLVIEHWKMRVIGSTFANLASASRDMIKLLRNAWLYWNHEDYKTPVYLQAQLTNESSARYALVYMSPEITDPDYFDINPEINLFMEQGITIARLPWQGNQPGTLPTAITLENADGPIGAQTTKPIANLLNDLAISHIYNYDDSLTAFSSNLASSSSWNLFEVSGSTPALNDCVYIGCETDRAFNNILLNIGTAGVFVAEMALEYYNGAWTELTYGDEFTIHPEGSPAGGDLFDATGEWWINICPPEDATTVSINSVDIFWYRLRIDSWTSWTTSPAVGTYQAWNFKKNYISIANNRIWGDAFPVTSIRLHAPAGGDEDPGPSSLTQIVMGLKSNPGNFESNLICSSLSSVVSGWADSNGTDTSGAVAPEGPRGECKACSFATDETLITRVTLTGTGKLGDWKGRYRAFLRVQQESGSAGDISVRLRTYIDTNNAYSPKWDTPIVALKTVDEGPELVSMGELKIPFIDWASADTFTNADLIFEIQAKRDTGAGTLNIYDLILIPADEWISTLYALIGDTTNCPSALRTNCVVEDDGGVLENRTVKYYNDGGTLYPTQEWGRGGVPIQIPVATACKIYFLMAHKPLGGAWSDNYLISCPGTFLKFQLYTQPYYFGLRG